MPSRSPALQVSLAEVRRTLHGESSQAGLPCVLVRLAGCPLRCAYCDTPEARAPGPCVALDALLDRIDGFGARRVLVTGGEPLAQEVCVPLLEAMCDRGLDVSLETSGAFDIRPIPGAVRRIVDHKGPSSGESARMLPGNLDAMGPHDELKFVIADRLDFQHAVEVIRRGDLERRTQLLLSPAHGQLPPVELARWLLEEGLDARLNLQLHKLIFGPRGDAALDSDAT